MTKTKKKSRIKHQKSTASATGSTITRRKVGIAGKKKAIRKATKKTTKKIAKKTAQKKVAKKTAKKITRKKVAKKTAKKITRKKVTKKTAKKTARKKVAKKTAKKTAQKKVAKKTAKKTTRKKVAKKTAKKTTRKKVAKKIVKKTIRKRVAKKTTGEAKNPDMDFTENYLKQPVIPTNFIPYQLRTDEDYMNPVQMEHFKQLLLDQKRMLLEGIQRTVQDLQESEHHFADDTDRASKEEEVRITLRTRNRERKLLKKIDAALLRIANGTYGYCEETGEEIGIRRLEARPTATLSLEAQSRHEKRKNLYRDNDDID